MHMSQAQTAEYQQGIATYETKIDAALANGNVVEADRLVAERDEFRLNRGLSNPVRNSNGFVIGYDCPTHRGSRMNWRALYGEYECHKNVQGVLFVNHHN